LLTQTEIRMVVSLSSRSVYVAITPVFGIAGTCGVDVNPPNSRALAVPAP